MKKLALSLVLWTVISAPTRADVTLPSIFSHNAVIQSEVLVPIWGWSNPNEIISVSTTPSKGRTSTRANKDGRWQVKIGPFKPGSKLTIQVKGENQVTINNVLAGEVWLCSGQSNMAMTVARCKDFEKEKANAKYPQIRMFLVARTPNTTPQEKVTGRWVVCSPKTVGGFTGTGYFFGREIHKRLKTPVGLINSSVGGTAIEAWTSMSVQKDDPKLKPIFDEWHKLDKAYDAEETMRKYQRALARWKERAAVARKQGKRPPRRPRLQVKPTTDRNYPSNLFNGMINPLIPYAIRGAIWYQGERNARTPDSAKRYAHQLPLLIQDWRKRWNQGDFPFFWAQLPNFKARSDDPGQTTAWALMRESMAKALEVKNSGMAITIDVGEAKDIHPKNKQDVGKRLALQALAKVYNKDVIASGPLYESHSIDGSKVVVSFKYAKELKVRGDTLRGFAIQDQKGRWHWAKAKVDGDKVTVWSSEVESPKAVRYAFGDNPEATLINEAGLPAGPFRTDR